MEEEASKPTQQNNNKKMYALIASVFLAVGILSIFLFFSKKKNVSVSPPSATSVMPEDKTGIAQTTLAFSPSPYALTATTGSLAITIASDSNKITAAQLEISYDPTMLTNITITPGTFFDNPLVLLKNIDSKNGKIFYAIALQPTAQAKSGAGTLATITFTSTLTPSQKTQL